MLTDEQIRTLNDARTILKEIDAPHTWSGGRASAIYERAENAVFQALNVTRSYLHQTISDDKMHNVEADRTRSLGHADHVEVVGDENGFELHISTDQGSYFVNIHGVAADLYWQARREIGSWLNEAEIARRTRPVTDDADAYDPSDPKHPGWSVRVADSYDAQRGDR